MQLCMYCTRCDGLTSGSMHCGCGALGGVSGPHLLLACLDLHNRSPPARSPRSSIHLILINLFTQQDVSYTLQPSSPNDSI